MVNVTKTLSWETAIETALKKCPRSVLANRANGEHDAAISPAAATRGTARYFHFEYNRPEQIQWKRLQECHPPSPQRTRRVLITEVKMHLGRDVLPESAAEAWSYKNNIKYAAKPCKLKILKTSRALHFVLISNKYHTKKYFSFVFTQKHAL